MHTIAEMKHCLKAKGVKGYSGKSKAELHKMCMSHGCMPDAKDPPRFIQKVVSAPGFRKGALTKKAKKHHETALEFAKHVVAHPHQYDERTRKQSQFAININKRNL